MEIEIEIQVSDKIIDKMVSFMEGLPDSKLITTQILEITTPDDSQENINNWLSEQRKIDFAEKLGELDKEHTYTVEKISISR